MQEIKPSVLYHKQVWEGADKYEIGEQHIMLRSYQLFASHSVKFAKSEMRFKSVLS